MVAIPQPASAQARSSLPPAHGAQYPSASFSALQQGEARAQATLFRALADPTRLQILALLRDQAEQLCVSELVNQFRLAQPTISHHLHLLREAKLVDFRKHGLHAYYFVCPETLAQAQRLLDTLYPPTVPEWH